MLGIDQRTLSNSPSAYPEAAQGMAGDEANAILGSLESMAVLLSSHLQPAPSVIVIRFLLPTTSGRPKSAVGAAAMAALGACGATTAGSMLTGVTTGAGIGAGAATGAGA